MPLINQRFPASPRVRTRIITFLFVALFGWVAAESPLPFFGVAVLTIGFLGVGVFLIALEYLWFWFKQMYMQPVQENFLIWLFAASLCVAFIGCGLAKDAWRAHQAKSFVSMAAAQIDAVQKRTSLYPGGLSSELESQKPSHVKYESNLSSYSFTYRRPLDPTATYLYDSSTHRWEKWSSFH